MTIGIIGSGNVADVLAETFFSAGHTVSFICSRNTVKGKKIATKVKAVYFSGISKTLPPADLTILAVSDNALPAVARQLADNGKPVVHTSGATSVTVLHKFISHGVFYPVNTLTAGNTIEAGTFFCIEGNTSSLLRSLKKAAASINCRSVSADSNQRMAVHVAAVFANNFVNACYQSAFDVLKKKGISFTIMQPLLNATLKKALLREPKLNQTGPAVRADSITLKKHRQFLKNDKELQKVYAALSALIVNQQTNV
jgi:predicted short-subunit dehydrogenase-like oxidoreductase (DUF2520 family)